MLVSTPLNQLHWTGFVNLCVGSLGSEFAKSSIISLALRFSKLPEHKAQRKFTKPMKPTVLVSALLNQL